MRLKVDIIVVRQGTSGSGRPRKRPRRFPSLWRVLVRSCWGGPVESLARPGGNVTGLTGLTRELGGKRLELLKEAVPKLSRVAVLYDPANPRSVKRDERASPSRGACAEVDYSTLEIRACERFREGICCAEIKRRPDGLYVLAAGPLIAC